MKKSELSTFGNRLMGYVKVLLTLDKFINSTLFVTVSFLSVAAQAQTDSVEVGEHRVKWHVDAVAEGQWNVKTGHVNWANMLSGGVEVSAWRGGSLELGALATGSINDGIVDDLQGFSNINAESREFRLTHLGVGQQLFGKLYIYAGLREADEDYFNTDGAGIFTGSSYGCVPQVGENFTLGVYPEAALGLHLEYLPTDVWMVRTTIYNGTASDRLNRQFRFCPGSDGLINIGSISYSPTFARFLDDRGETTDGFLAPTYVLGYVAGWQYIEGDIADDATETATPEKQRRKGGAVWASVDQPIARVGRAGLNLFATGGVRFGQLDMSRSHWAVALLLGNLMHRGATLAMVVSQAHYADKLKETDIETTFDYPVLSCLSLQPAMHFIRTDGETNVAVNLRLSFSIECFSILPFRLLTVIKHFLFGEGGGSILLIQSCYCLFETPLIYRLIRNNYSVIFAYK